MFCMLNISDVMNVKRLYILGNKIPLWLFGFLYWIQTVGWKPQWKRSLRLIIQEKAKQAKAPPMAGISLPRQSTAALLQPKWPTCFPTPKTCTDWTRQIQSGKTKRTPSTPTLPSTMGQVTYMPTQLMPLWSSTVPSRPIAQKAIPCQYPKDGTW